MLYWEIQKQRSKYGGPHGYQRFPSLLDFDQVANSRAYEKRHGVPMNGIAGSVRIRAIAHWEDYSGKIKSTSRKQSGKTN